MNKPRISPSFRPSSSVLLRFFASGSENVVPKKSVEDVMPIATGHEREEIEAELQGKDILEINHPVGPSGTKPFYTSVMATEEAKDPLKDVDWKNMGKEVKNEVETEKTVTKKRLPKKIRQIPDYYFLPRRSLPSAIAFYGSFIVAGVGAGMLLEAWINKKVKEDGGVIWEFDK